MGHVLLLFSQWSVFHLELWPPSGVFPCLPPPPPLDALPRHQTDSYEILPANLSLSCWDRQLLLGFFSVQSVHPLGLILQSHGSHMAWHGDKPSLTSLGQGTSRMLLF